jgi:hypothetical protein
MGRRPVFILSCVQFFRMGRYRKCKKLRLILYKVEIYSQVCCLIHAGLLPCLLLNPTGGCDTPSETLVDIHQEYAVLYLRRQNSSRSTVTAFGVGDARIETVYCPNTP